MKLLPLTLFLITTSRVFADKIVWYSCYNAHGGLDNTGNNEVEHGSSVLDDRFAAKLIHDMPAKSSGKYVAKQSPTRKGLIIISCKEKVQSRDESYKAIGEMQGIVGGMLQDLVIKGHFK